MKMDINFKPAADIAFNFRVSGVVLSGDRVLIHKVKGDRFYTLPGGRCKMFEDSFAALEREFKEELKMSIVKIRLLWIVENFCTFKKVKFHEIGLVYLVRILDKKPSFETIEVHQEDKALQFKWVKLADMDSINMKPAFLIKALTKLPNSTTPVIVKGNIVTDI